MRDCHVLSQYPVSRAFGREIAERAGSQPEFTNLTGSAAGSIGRIWAAVRAIRAERVFVAVEDEGSAATVPILQTLASLSHGRTLWMVMPGQEPQAFSRGRAVGATMALAARSVWAAGILLLTYLRLSRLRGVPRVAVGRRAATDVLYLNANLWFGVKAGGSVGHISGVVNGLSGRGFGVTFASGGGRLMVDSRAHYCELPPLRGLSFPPETTCYTFARTILGSVMNIVAAGNYGFIYQRLSMGNATGVEVSRRQRLPLVSEYNGSEAWVAKHWGRPLKFHRLAVLAEEVVLHHSHVVVTISDVLKDELVQRGVDPRRIVMYPNCIDPVLFDPARFAPETVAELRKRYGIPGDALVGTFVGTFGQWHGAEVLAAAIRLLLDGHAEWLAERRIRFLLVGDGAKMPAVREILRHPLAEKFVVIAGLVPQPEAPLHLAASDVLFSPHVANPDGSRFFGSPTKLFEYMAMGLPIVASDLDQIGDVLNDSLRVNELPDAPPADAERRLALLTAPGSAGDIVSAFRFLVENAAWRVRLGQNVRREALEKYTWDRHVQEIVAGLDRALELPPG